MKKTTSAPRLPSPRHGHAHRTKALHVLLLVLASMLPGICEAAPKKPLKVFVLVGQSNMQGHAKIETIDHIAMDPATASWIPKLRNRDGAPTVYKEVPISYLSTKGVKQGPLTSGFGADESKIGPELTFGITLHEHLNEPILIIKTAWGGKSLHTDFRPPGAGEYVFTQKHLQLLEKLGKDAAALQAKKKKDTGRYYKLTTDHIKSVLADIQSVYPDYDPNQGYQLSGLVWFQGWNDMVDPDTYPDRERTGGYSEYTKLLTQLIHDLRKDLSAPELPVVIGVMGVGGPTEKYGPDQQRYIKVHQNFRDAMAAVAAQPEFKGNVSAVLTENYWDMELDALVARDGKLRHEVKKKKLHGKEAQAMLDQLRKKEFSSNELAILEAGVSNYPFHYLGSAKILGGIGIGFAEAMAELQTP